MANPIFNINISKKEIALELLNQLMDMERARDAELCRFYILTHKATKTVGESQILSSLKVLRELINDL